MQAQEETREESDLASILAQLAAKNFATSVWTENEIVAYWQLGHLLSILYKQSADNWPSLSIARILMSLLQQFERQGLAHDNHLRLLFETVQVILAQPVENLVYQETDQESYQRLQAQFALFCANRQNYATAERMRLSAWPIAAPYKYFPQILNGIDKYDEARPHEETKKQSIRKRQQLIAAFYYERCHPYILRVLKNPQASPTEKTAAWEKAQMLENGLISADLCFLLLDWWYQLSLPANETGKQKEYLRKFLYWHLYPKIFTQQNEDFGLCCHQQQLASLRETLQNDLKQNPSIAQQNFYQQWQTWLAELWQEAEQWLVTSSYLSHENDQNSRKIKTSLLNLGSASRGLAGAYSDLEYALLTEFVADSEWESAAFNGTLSQQRAHYVRTVAEIFELSIHALSEKKYGLELDENSQPRTQPSLRGTPQQLLPQCLVGIKDLYDGLLYSLLHANYLTGDKELYHHFQQARQQFLATSCTLTQWQQFANPLSESSIPDPLPSYHRYFGWVQMQRNYEEYVKYCQTHPRPELTLKTPYLKLLTFILFDLALLHQEYGCTLKELVERWPNATFPLSRHTVQQISMALEWLWAERQLLHLEHQRTMDNLHSSQHPYLEYLAQHLLRPLYQQWPWVLQQSITGGKLPHCLLLPSLSPSPTLLFTAIREAHLPRILYLLAQPVDVNSQNAHGDTPLHLALLANLPWAIIEKLLKHGADPKLKNHQGQSVLEKNFSKEKKQLIYATYRFFKQARRQVLFTRLQQLENLYLTEASTICRKPFPSSALAAANAKAVAEVVVPSLYLTQEFPMQESSSSKKPDLSKVPPQFICKLSGKIMYNPVTNSAGENYEREEAQKKHMVHLFDNTNLKSLINEFLSLNPEYKEYQYLSAETVAAMSAAIKARNLNNIKTLLGLDARLYHWPLENQKNMLQMVCLDPQAKLEFLEALVQVLQIRSSEWKRLVTASVMRGNTVESKLTPLDEKLIVAVKQGNIALIKILAQLGGNLQLQTGIAKKTLLHYAAEAGQAETFQLLLTLKVPYPKEENAIQPLLHLAAEKGNVEIVKSILTTECDVNNKNRNGQTALHKAVISNQPVIVELLLAAKANADLSDEEGNTPLHYAMQHQSDKAIIVGLLRKGASYKTPNHKHKTPLDMAVNDDDRIYLVQEHRKIKRERFNELEKRISDLESYWGVDLGSLSLSASRFSMHAQPSRKGKEKAEEERDESASPTLTQSSMTQLTNEFVLVDDNVRRPSPSSPTSSKD